MRKEDQQEQAISFAYGNVALSNPAVTKEGVLQAYAALSANQPLYIGDFVTGKIGLTWTAEDAEEVMRQWRRMDELAQELITRAHTAKT